MPRKRSDVKRLEDLRLFCRVCEFIEKQPHRTASVSTVAKALGLGGKQDIQRCVARLEEDHKDLVPQGRPCNLLVSHARSPRSWVSEHGRCLFERWRGLLLMDSPLVENVRVGASGLILSHIMPRAVARWRREWKDVANLRFFEQYDFAERVRRVRDRQLDWAVSWCHHGRLADDKDVGFWVIEDAKFDCPLICHMDHAIAKAHARSKEPMEPISLTSVESAQLYSLSRGQQPLLDELTPATRSGEIVMDYYASIINHVRMVDDAIAFVPGIYADLDHYRKLGQLFYAPVRKSDGSLEKL